MNNVYKISYRITQINFSPFLGNFSENDRPSPKTLILLGFLCCRSVIFGKNQTSPILRTFVRKIGLVFSRCRTD